MPLSTALGNLLGGVRSPAGACCFAAGAALMFAVPARGQVTTWPVEQRPAVSQFSSTQLNQLFLFENTPNKSAAGEGYVSGHFSFMDFPHRISTERYEVQGEYAFSDQFAVGGIIPIIHNNIPGNSSTGFGDITPYIQAKLDSVIPHDIADVSFQFDVVLPTGDKGDRRDFGRFGVRPWIQAYKDFGAVGPGHFGAYGEMGFTLIDHSDFRWGLAAQYEYEKAVYGILEFYNQTGGYLGRPLVNLTPGVVIRPGPFEFGIGLPFGLNDGSPRWGIVVRATWGW